MKGIAGCVAIICAAGCGGSEIASHAPTYGAGGRLKPIVFDLGGGAEIPIVGLWEDTALDEECAFDTAEDGRLRCLPFPYPSKGPAAGGTLVYEDATCSAAVLFHDPPCDTAPQWAHEFLPGDCGRGGQRFYRVASSRARPAALFQRDTDGACVPFDEAGLVAPSFYALESTAPDAFVAGQTTTRERAPSLAAEVIEAEDGAWIITGFSDPAHGGSCRPAGWTYDPALACLPAPVAWSGVAGNGESYVDPACAALGAQSLSPCSPPPRVGRLDNPPSGTCPTPGSYRLFDIQPITGTLYGDDGTGACAARSDPAAPQAVYAFGSEVEVGSFPKLEIVQVGGGRLRAGFLGSGGVPFRPYNVFVASPADSSLRDQILDTSSGLACAWQSFSDGKLRCVPAASWITVSAAEGFYADAGCAGDRVYFGAAPPPGSCQGLPAPEGALVIADSKDPSCSIGGSIVDTRSIAPFTGTVVYYSDPASGACYDLPVDGTEPMFVLGSVRDPATLFAEIKRVTKG